MFRPIFCSFNTAYLLVTHLLLDYLPSERGPGPGLTCTGRREDSAVVFETCPSRRGLFPVFAFLGQGRDKEPKWRCFASSPPVQVPELAGIEFGDHFVFLGPGTGTLDRSAALAFLFPPTLNRQRSGMLSQEPCVGHFGELAHLSEPERADLARWGGMCCAGVCCRSAIVTQPSQRCSGEPSSTRHGRENARVACVFFFFFFLGGGGLLVASKCLCPSSYA